MIISGLTLIYESRCPLYIDTPQLRWTCELIEAVKLPGSNRLATARQKTRELRLFELAAADGDNIPI